MEELSRFFVFFGGILIVMGVPVALCILIGLNIGKKATKDIRTGERRPYVESDME